MLDDTISKLKWMFGTTLHLSQRIESANNNMRLHLIDVLDQLGAEAVAALDAKRPNWRDEIEKVFFDVQDAIEPLGLIATDIEDILPTEGVREEG
jgi:hypothetical protein